MQLGGLGELIRPRPTHGAGAPWPAWRRPSRDALERVRSVSRGLRPPALDELGLVPALRELAGQCASTWRWWPTPLPPLSPAVEVAAYRVGAEALTNVARHAGSTQARLRVGLDGRNTCGRGRRDPGRGRGDEPRGVGTISMRERAEELGGTLDVRSSEDAGTTVEARFPVVDSRGAAMITVVLADDHPMFREGLRFTLEQADDIPCRGRGRGRRGGAGRRREHRPDVVVMDLAMPRLDGLAATSRLVDSGCRVLVLTFNEEDASVLAAMRAGALGYLRKGAEPAQVVSAVRSTAAGHAVFGPGIAGRMLEVFAERPPQTRDRFPELSPREREILEHLAEGLSNREIAALLVISPVTVRNHVSNILAKLHLANRREAMVRFRDGGAGS